MPKYQVGFEWEEMRDSTPVEGRSIEIAKAFALDEDQGGEGATVFLCREGKPNEYVRYDFRFERKVEVHLEKVTDDLVRGV